MPTTTNLPTLDDALRNYITSHADEVQAAIDYATEKMAQRRMDTADAVSSVHEELCDIMLEDGFILTDCRAGRLVSFLNVCVAEIADMLFTKPRPQKILQLDNFLRGKALGVMCENAGAFSRYYHELLALYCQGEADEKHVFTYTAARFIELLKHKKVKLTQTFRCAILELAMLATLTYIAAERVRLLHYEE